MASWFPERPSRKRLEAWRRWVSRWTGLEEAVEFCRRSSCLWAARPRPGAAVLAAPRAHEAARWFGVLLLLMQELTEVMYLFIILDSVSVCIYLSIYLPAYLSTCACECLFAACVRSRVRMCVCYAFPFCACLFLIPLLTVWNEAPQLHSSIKHST